MCQKRVCLGGPLDVERILFEGSSSACSSGATCARSKPWKRDLSGPRLFHRLRSDAPFKGAAGHARKAGVAPEKEYYRGKRPHPVWKESKAYVS